MNASEEVVLPQNNIQKLSARRFLSKREILSMRLQRVASFLAFPLLGSFVFSIYHSLLAYRIQNHLEHRRFYRELVKDKTPLIICSNHRTYADPTVLIWAFGSVSQYLMNFRSMAWNLPASKYAQKSRWIKMLAYLTSCRFIERGARRDNISTSLSEARHLVEQGEVMIIFPEGTRSREDRFEVNKLKSGASKIIAQIPRTRVLCTHLRADSVRHSGFPPRHSNFHLSYRLLHFTEASGREAEIEILSKIGACIQSLEEKYFSELESNKNKTNS